MCSSSLHRMRTADQVPLIFGMPSVRFSVHLHYGPCRPGTCVWVLLPVHLYAPMYFAHGGLCKPAFLEGKGSREGGWSWAAISLSLKLLCVVIPTAHHQVLSFQPPNVSHLPLLPTEYSSILSHRPPGLASSLASWPPFLLSPNHIPFSNQRDVLEILIRPCPTPA